MAVQIQQDAPKRETFEDRQIRALKELDRLRVVAEKSELLADWTAYNLAHRAYIEEFEQWSR